MSNTSVVDLEQFEETAIALTYRQTPEQKQALEKRAFDQAAHICAAYTKQNLDGRIRTLMAFDDKASIQRLMLRFAQKCVDSAADALYLYDTTKAIPSLKAGAVADLILDGRGDVSVLEMVQDSLIALSERASFDLAAYVQPLAVESEALLRKAFQAHQAERPTEVSLLVDRVLAREPKIVENPRYADLIDTLRGKSTRDARRATQEFMRNTLAQEVPAVKTSTSTHRRASTTSTVRVARETETQEAKRAHESAGDSILGFLFGAVLAVLALAGLVLAAAQAGEAMAQLMRSDLALFVVVAVAVGFGLAMLVFGTLSMINGRGMFRFTGSDGRRREWRGSPARAGGLAHVLGALAIGFGIAGMVVPLNVQVANASGFSFIAAGVAQFFVGIVIYALLYGIGFGYLAVERRRRNT
jgi:hypothetical protein